MVQDSSSESRNQTSEIDVDVLSGDACVKCDFRCIQGCV
jgi:hypothetical protein